MSLSRSSSHDRADRLCNSRHRGRQDSAQKLFSLLPAHYVDLRWVKIEAALLDQCTHLQESLDMSRERLLSTLALIRAGAELGTSRWNLDSVCEPSLKHSREEDMSNLAKKLMNDVYTLSSKLAKGKQLRPVAGLCHAQLLLLLFYLIRLCSHCLPNLFNAARQRYRLNSRG